MLCNQQWLPIIFLQDVNGFMVGRDSEQSGIIKAGAKLVNAIANSRVPKITLVTGGSFGAGNYALCGKAFDPRLIYAWPTARCSRDGCRAGDQHAARYYAQVDRAAPARKRTRSNLPRAVKKCREITNARWTRVTPLHTVGSMRSSHRTKPAIS